MLLRQRAEDLLVVDVRSPAEFAKGHWIGSVNIPLFSNEERAQVGTTYKQVDPRQAFLEGLEIVGPKMRGLVEHVDGLIEPGSPFGVYCWRGGSRSGAFSWLLGQAGFEVFRVVGGYKNYRKVGRCLLEAFPFQLNVIDGPTGSGKTKLLHHLRDLGAQVLDLEGIANHKGSAFGLEPGAKQPSSEHAENLIHHHLSGFDESLPVWIENESKNIGKVYLPDPMVEAIGKGHRITLEVPIADRISHIVEQYGTYPRGQLAETFHHLQKKLGGKATQDAISAVSSGDLATAARIALVYYDKAYAHYTQRQAHQSSERVVTSLELLGDLAKILHRRS